MRAFRSTGRFLADWTASQHGVGDQKQVEGQLEEVSLPSLSFVLGAAASEGLASNTSGHMEAWAPRQLCLSTRDQGWSSEAASACQPQPVQLGNILSPTHGSEALSLGSQNPVLQPNWALTGGQRSQQGLLPIHTLASWQRQHLEG